MNWFWVPTVLAGAFALYRTTVAGLRASWFQAYIALSIGCTFVLFFMANYLPQRKEVRNAYAAFWIASLIIKLIVEVLMCLECFRLMCRQYPGIGTFARGLLFSTCSIAIAISAASLYADIGVLKGAGSIWIASVKISQRYLSSALAVSLIGIQVFFARYPASWPPNVRRHGIILTTYMAIIASSHLIYTMTSGSMRIVHDQVLMALEVGCYLTWAILITRAGELAPKAKEIDDAEVARADAELDKWIVGINATLKQVRAERQ